jgi:hypothetical protein
VDQEKNDRDDKQNVKQTAQCVAGDESEEPEYEQQKHEKQHGKLPLDDLDSPLNSGRCRHVQAIGILHAAATETSFPVARSSRVNPKLLDASAAKRPAKPSGELRSGILGPPRSMPA